ncbi:MAG: 2,3-bisphosphoglycerate-independent phosphoglycerate mutase [bacterium]|nr:2,3-bisphosphoglycerate-independent phosphoglycerate mutase [bacterium]
MQIKPVVLLILDGWGIAAASRGNAITQAKTPNIDRLTREFFSTTLAASGEAVGLFWGEQGNSEVGHLTMGTGRIAYQSLPRITRAITNGSFYENSAFLKAAEHVKKNGSTLHLIGLVSAGGVHSYSEHGSALLEFAKKHSIQRVVMHVILDGRDTPFNSGKNYLEHLVSGMRHLGVGEIGSVMGRFFAMDRDARWDRTAAAYHAMVQGLAEEKTTDPIAAVQSFYDREIYDEQIPPCVVVDSAGKPKGVVSDGDAVIFFNFRGDRARQLTKAFVLPTVTAFERPQHIQDLFFVTMTEYETGLPVEIAFPEPHITYPVARVVSEAGMKQVRIAETEKYAHVTYFFNGRREEPFGGEERILIPSPHVERYDEVPEMSAKEVTKNTLKAIASGTFPFVLVNYANADMVGHTGNLAAVVQACERVDKEVGAITDRVLADDGIVMITADHGNAEEILKPASGLIDKEHSTNPVPFILCGRAYRRPEPGVVDLSGRKPEGVLADVGVTTLKLLGLDKPTEMTGIPLV